MAQSPARRAADFRGGRVVGDYMLGRKIGKGSYSEVWHARHRITGVEVAVKEIVLEPLSEKLQQSLLSEIVILKRINHPNIISLHDIIEAFGRIYIILEYCRGGDLSMYIQRHGRVPEITAKNFMQQLATGLQVLRQNSIIHRDLKPQNLLLSTFDDNAQLKIADFGFARSLQSLDLAETLCGSPLYMAPEIMQHQKYNFKADLWSVGVILFQLVTGKPPFTGNNQMQLLENILRSNEIRFPPDNNLSSDCIDLCQKLLRRIPVERLTFEEFFDHQFLSQRTSEKSLSRTTSSTRDASPLVECSQDECLPFLLDDESNEHDVSPMVNIHKGLVGPAYGSYADSEARRSQPSSPSKISGLSRYSSKHKQETTDYRHDFHGPLGGNVKETKLFVESKLVTNASTKDSAVVDSLEFIDQDYVLVPGPVSKMPSSSVNAFHQPKFSHMSESRSVPVPVVYPTITKTCSVESFEIQSSPASGTSQGSMDMDDAVDQPSPHFMTRIRSLQKCASAITDLVKEEKDENGRQLEAFSIQLVVLAIWKQALHICHAQAASDMEGGPSKEPRTRNRNKDAQSILESFSNIDSQQMDAVCSRIEKEFLLEIEHAEELSRDLGLLHETTEMPDAIELIFQSALSLGRTGAVDEMMNNYRRAAARYSKAVCLLTFIQVEAPSLVLNPPFSLTSTDRHRISTYINIISNRQCQLRT